jgi:predicted ribosome quality control (RQC) complex YloA/Tae2 family protein
VKEVERLKTSGELILAYASQVTAEQQTLAAETDTGILEIPLNPTLSAVENAQMYFN